MSETTAAYPAPFALLPNKTAVVTGSSSGLGRAIALELAAAGCHVVVHARQHRDGAEATAEQIRSLGRDALVLLADIAQPEQRARLVDDAWQWRGMVDVWVNNAGADVLTTPIAKQPFDERLRLLWQVDVEGTIGLARAAGERMKLAGRAPGSCSILNMGWDQAEIGMAGESGEMFGTIKGAIMAFTRSLAKSLAPHVRVNCLAPGWIRTAWGETASEYWQQRAVRESLLGRWGTPEDVARVARFLASDAASFLTGQIYPINGGFRTTAVESS